MVDPYDLHVLKREFAAKRLTRKQFLHLGFALGFSSTALLATVRSTSARGLPAAYRQDAEPTGSVTFLSAENLLGRWDPFNNSNLAHYRLQQSGPYDFLIREDPELGLAPSLATEWQMLDPAQWEIKLRPNVSFHDGTPFGAKDVKASLEYASDPKQVSASNFSGPLEVEIVDDLTVRVHTPQPFAAFLNVLAHGQGACIAPEADIQNPDNFLERMMGTGPYQWVSYDGEAGGVKMTANMNYWGGVPKIKEYIFRYVGDSNTRLQALQLGQAQIIDRVEPDQIAILEGSPDLAVDRVKTVESKWLAFRLNDPPLDNKALRRAICHAIDVPTIVDRILLGAGRTNDSMLTNTQNFYRPEPLFPKYDPEMAKQLLAEAGYPNGEGLAPITFNVSVGFYPKTKEYGEYIVQNLKDIGVTLDLRLLEVAAYNQGLYVHTPNTINDHGWFVPSTDPQVIFTTLFRTEGMITGVSDPDVDALIAKQGEAMDEAERTRIIQEELVPALADRMIEFPMFSTELTSGYTKKLEGFSVPPTSEHQIWQATLAS